MSQCITKCNRCRNIHPFANREWQTLKSYVGKVNVCPRCKSTNYLLVIDENGKFCHEYHKLSEKAKEKLSKHEKDNTTPRD
jgi:hypothetical protein